MTRIPNDSFRIDLDTTSNTTIGTSGFFASLRHNTSSAIQPNLLAKKSLSRIERGSNAFNAVSTFSKSNTLYRSRLLLRAAHRVIDERLCKASEVPRLKPLPYKGLA